MSAPAGPPVAHLDGEVLQVLVVGAGPTGVVAATMLAQRGVSSLVIDRHAGIYPLPRAVHLDDEIYRILQSIGAADAFSAITEPRLGLRVVDGRLRSMARFDRTRPVGDHGWPQANFFDQPELEEVLRDNASRFPQVRFAGRTELVCLEQEQPGHAPVRAVLRDLDTGVERTVWAEAVLGCDGANSTVRDLIGGTLLDLGFEERWLVVDIRSTVPLDVWNGVDQVSDTHRPATFMQVMGERYRWEFRINDGERVEDLTRPERLAALIAPWTRDIPFESFEIIRQAEYTFRARIADRWRDRRVFLIGDAAHLTPPFIGQGLCAAMRDASNLTWKLASVLSAGAPESLLATYEVERPEPAKGPDQEGRSAGHGHDRRTERAVPRPSARAGGTVPAAGREREDPRPAAAAPPVRAVGDEAVEPGRSEVAETLPTGATVAAMVRGVHDEPGRVERLRQPVVSGGVLGQPVRHLDDADRRVAGVGPGVGGDLGAIGGRGDGGEAWGHGASLAGVPPRRPAVVTIRGARDRTNPCVRFAAPWG